MKKVSLLTLATSILLVLIFGFLLFTFQVRQTQIAAVTTFGKYSRSITNAGFQVRWPYPIQSVYRCDNRIQDFSRKFEETTTSDAINVLVKIYVGWQIVDPQLYLQSLNGDALEAEKVLEPLLRKVQNEVIGAHVFGDLISTNTAALKFDQIEQEMLRALQPETRSSYGINIRFVGLKQLGLPESITSKVFDRMKAERQTRVKQFQTEGEREAKRLRADADIQANQILAEARAHAIEITGAAEAKASQYYRVLQENPELANFLFQRNAIEQALKEHTTLVLDQKTPPLNLLRGETPAAPIPVPAPAPAPASTNTMH